MDIIRHFPIFIIIILMLTAVLISIVSTWKKSFAMPLAATAMGSSLLMSLALIPEVLKTGYISYYLSSWEPPWGIEIKIDYIGLFMMLLVSGVSLASIFFSHRYISHEVSEDRRGVFYTLFVLISASMLGFSATGDIFNMFVFIEIMSLTSYALVAITGTGKAVAASFKYLVMGAPSSILIILAISFLYSVTGTLNMGDLTVKIAASEYPVVAMVAYGLFIIGFAVKAALFPLHTWLPDAHSIAPSPVSAILSGLFVKTGVFGIIRLTFSIFTLNYSEGVNAILTLLSWVGVLAIIYGSIAAIREKELKRMVAYSTVAHIGYIILGIGLINKAGLTGGLFHIIDHSLAKACFFLAAGAIVYKSGYRSIPELKGAGKKMPFTCGAFALAALSLVGIPPTAGFVSKWYLISGSLQSGNLFFAAIYLIGSLLAAIYCLRIVYYMFFLPPEDSLWREVKNDAPSSMIVPLWFLAGATLLLGTFSFLILPSLGKAVERLIG